MSKFFIDLESNATDRFDMSKFLEFTDNFDPLNSAMMSDVSTLPQGGQYTVQGEDGRPDLVSYRIYGHSQYWWILLIYNTIIDYSAIKTGDVLKYPSIDSIEGFYFSLKTREVAASKNT